jgi:hypothetical protein
MMAQLNPLHFTGIPTGRHSVTAQMMAQLNPLHYTAIPSQFHLLLYKIKKLESSGM